MYVICIHFSLKDEMAKIMASEEYKKDNQLYANRLAESLHPEYDILQHAKLYFMDR